MVRGNTIDTLDYRSIRVTFSEKKLRQKAVQHPELRKPAFIKRIIETLKNPIEVWPDYSNPNEKRCYYKKYSQFSYAKVVVYYKCNPCNIVTAFETNYIKESKYPGLRRIK